MVHHIPDLIRLGSASRTGAHWSEQQYRSLLTGERGADARLALIAECEWTEDLPEKIPPVVGFLVARNMAPEWELENIVVASESRGKGVGTRLIEELLSRAKQTNSKQLFLEVRDSNQAARSFYGKLGFVQTGRRKSYYSNPIEDAVLYCKDL